MLEKYFRIFLIHMSSSAYITILLVLYPLFIVISSLQKVSIGLSLKIQEGNYHSNSYQVIWKQSNHS